MFHGQYTTEILICVNTIVYGVPKLWKLKPLYYFETRKNMFALESFAEVQPKK